MILLPCPTRRRWLPGSDGRLHRPCDQFLYQRTKAIESIMKGTVVYLQAEVTNEVAKALGVKACRTSLFWFEE